MTASGISAVRGGVLIGQLTERTSLVYSLAFVAWVMTRVAVLIHQGGWPWMNGRLISIGQQILDGNWTRAFERPPLPSLAAIPALAMGANEQQTVAFLYLGASLLQFGALLLFVRCLFPNRTLEQAFALLLWLLLPFNHSIHHYRNASTLFGSAGMFLLAAHWLWVTRAARREILDAKSLAWAALAIGIGAWSRMEVLLLAVLLAVPTFAGVGPRAGRVGVVYVTLVVVVAGLLLGGERLVGADLAVSQHYRASTFLTSTPLEWVSPECRAAPTESCISRDGRVIFGQTEDSADLMAILLGNPGLAILKSLIGAFRNLQEVFGGNISTYSPLVWLLWGMGLATAQGRSALRGVPRPAWTLSIAVLAISVLPPLIWAPVYPQYHLQTFMPVIVLSVPILVALMRSARGSVLVWSFWLGTAALSIFRYTRYTGY